MISLPRLRLAPNSGAQSGLIQLASVFDASAITFAKVGIEPLGAFTATVDPASGQVDLGSVAGHLGLASLRVSATDAAGRSSLQDIVFCVAPEILFVDDDAVGSATGLSWADAMPALQDALAVGGFGYQIWVASGIYRPDQGAGQVIGDIGTRFELPDAIPLYGGFSGVESTLMERDLAASAGSILSADLGGTDWDPDGDGIIVSVNDQRTGATGVDNCRSVISSQALGVLVKLDGFVVTAVREYEGEQELARGEFEISNCRFIGNDRAMRLSAGAVALLRNCSFEANATAVLCDAVTASFVGCRFYENASEGLSASGSDLQVLNCHFRENDGFSLSAGGIYMTESSAVITGCLFEANPDGAIVDTYGEDLVVSHCTFTGYGENSSPAVRVGVASFDSCLFWDDVVPLRERDHPGTGRDYPGWGAGLYQLHRGALRWQR